VLASALFALILYTSATVQPTFFAISAAVIPEPNSVRILPDFELGSTLRPLRFLVAISRVCRDRIGSESANICIG
jgi:hypothetical protein